MEKFEIKFLGYKIVNSGNGDGYVLVDGGSIINSQDLDFVKRYTVIYFMTKYPKVYYSSIIHRIMGSGGTMHEWYTFRNHLKELGMEMPKELAKPVDALSCLIGYKGKRLFEVMTMDSIKFNPALSIQKGLMAKEAFPITQEEKAAECSGLEWREWEIRQEERQSNFEKGWSKCIETIVKGEDDQYA
jgi:hypothetical protein